MKCIQNKTTDEIVRVSNERASQLVETKAWAYTSKSKWKRLVRDRGKDEKK